MDRQLSLKLVVPSVKAIFPPVRVRIFTGAQLLDVMKKGPQWRGFIDLQRLNLQDPECCILGQLFDHYLAGCCELGLKHRQAVEHGFNVVDPESSGANGEFEVLTRGWRTYLSRSLRLAT